MLSDPVLVPLVVSAALCSSSVVPLGGGWVSSGSSLGLIAVVGVRWDSASSTAAYIWLITLPMVGSAPPGSLFPVLYVFSCPRCIADIVAVVVGRGCG